MSNPANEFNPALHNIPALDGVRGVAIILVLIVHAYYRGPDLDAGPFARSLFIFGWTGVELFFVLSGFLITSILLREYGQDAALKRFWAHRAARIMPLYFAILLVFFLVSFLPLPAKAELPFTNLREQIWVYLLYLSNFGDLLGFDTEEANKLLGPVWSLAVEQHYYLAWPLVVLTLGRLRARAVLLIAYIASVVARYFYASDATALIVYHTTFLHFDGIAIGSLVALWLPELVTLRRYWGLAFWIVAGSMIAVFLAAGTTHYSSPTVEKYGYVLIAISYAFFVLSVLNSRLLSKLFGTQILRSMGKYSYFIYLFHGPFLMALSQLNLASGFLSWMVFFVGYTVASYMAGTVSWKLLEKPASVWIKSLFEPTTSRGVGTKNAAADDGAR
jgi:peptidoglycan/LPS O-acetylase OafA/YrhL